MLWDPLSAFLPLIDSDMANLRSVREHPAPRGWVWAPTLRAAGSDSGGLLPPGQKTGMGTSKMVKWVKALAVKPDHLSSTYGTYGGRKEPPPESCPLTPTCALRQLCAHIIK